MVTRWLARTSRIPPRRSGTVAWVSRRLAQKSNGLPRSESDGTNRRFFGSLELQIPAAMEDCHMTWVLCFRFHRKPHAMRSKGRNDRATWNAIAMRKILAGRRSSPPRLLAISRHSLFGSREAAKSRRNRESPFQMRFLLGIWSNFSARCSDGILPAIA